MSSFIQFTTLSGQETVINMDHVRECTAPPDKTIGVTRIVFNRAVPVPQIEYVDVRMSYTELAARLCPPSMKLIQ